MHPKGISFGHLWINFSRALISTKFAYFWTDTNKIIDDGDQPTQQRVKLDE